jgi:negative regulator of sigma E activity
MKSEPMITEPRENLSSFMDGEVDKSAGSFLVRRLANDDQLRAIDQEDSPAAILSQPRAWARAVAGVAVAASVAMLAIVAVGPDQQDGPGVVTQAPALAVQAEPFVSPNIGTLIPASQPVNLGGQPAARQEKAKAYLLRHYQLTGDGAGQGFVALVPIVATGENAGAPLTTELLPAAEEAELPRQ